MPRVEEIPPAQAGRRRLCVALDAVPFELVDHASGDAVVLGVPASDVT